MTILPVTINYGAHAVQSPVNAAPIVHAMAEPGKTLCGKRPLDYSEHPNGTVTCEKCLSQMQPAKMKRREYAVAYRRQQLCLDDPEVERQMAATRGKSRQYVLTEAGQTLVDKWNREGE